MQHPPRPPPCRAAPSTSCSPSPRVALSHLPPPVLPSLAIPRPSTSGRHSRATAMLFRRASVAVLPSLFNSFCPEMCEAIRQPFLHFPSRPRTYPRRILAFCFGSECHRRPALVGSFLPALWVRSG
jgi:hypothetical protein